MKKITVCKICGKGGENGPLIKEIIGYPLPYQTGEYIHDKCELSKGEGR